MSKSVYAPWTTTQVKNLEFDLCIEDCKVSDVCPVLSIPLFVGDKQGHNSPTIDRLDNNKGYTKDNIQVISWRANNLKSDASLEEIKKLYIWLTNETK